jgi:exopolyphosphatase/guanosine-5'-triphosphate,3'-diphosphate pyrophosphatase
VSASGGEAIAAAIDVGSNSVLLLVVAVGSDGFTRALDEAVATTRLGAALRPGGTLDRAAVERTRDAVVVFADRARARGARAVWAFATGAARQAVDGPAFVADLTRAASAPVEILSGAREAALAYAAAVHGLGLGDDPVLAIDVGGATTELTLGRGPAIEASVSLELGALALTESGVALESMRRRVGEALGGTDLPARARAAGAVAVASGGTATSLAALDLALERYEPRRVHGARLATARLELLAAQAARAGAAIDPGRAAILPAGACIVAGVLHAIGADHVRVSDHGVRHAYLREHLAAAGVGTDMRWLWG